MSRGLKVLFYLGFLFCSGTCFAATTQLEDIIQLADSDTLNTLQGTVHSVEETLDWKLNLGLSNYQNRLETSDKVTLFRSQFDFLTQSNLLFGGGINFGYGALEKLTSFEPHLFVGYHWEKFEIRVGVQNTQYRHGSSVSQPSAGNVIEEDGFTFNMRGTQLQLRAPLTSWIEARASWTRWSTDANLKSRSLGTFGTQFTARRFGPVVSTLRNVPANYQNYEVSFHPQETIDFDFQHSRAEEEISGETSLDTGGLLTVRVGPFWSVGYGLGESSYRTQSQKYALIQVGYLF